MTIKEIFLPKEIGGIPMISSQVLHMIVQADGHCRVSIELNVEIPDYFEHSLPLSIRYAKIRQRRTCKTKWSRKAATMGSDGPMAKNLPSADSDASARFTDGIGRLPRLVKQGYNSAVEALLFQMKLFVKTNNTHIP
uniref:Uncharacterized protein n=1 Tax=Romanomermis culicivorax TaxID=13658 RepID=A0A915J8M6_ROMCU